MAYSNFINGFNITSNASIDKRLVMTKAEMAAAASTYQMPDHYFCICSDDNNLYIWDGTFPSEIQTGKFKNVKEVMHLSGEMYKIVITSDTVYKLQKSEDGGTTWSDVSTIDLTTVFSKKVDKEINSTDGKALIFNEVDGGGAKFEATNGTASFVGVNKDTNGGIGAQIYDIDVALNKGTKLDVTKNGIYYTKGDASAQPAHNRDVETNELVTRAVLKPIATTGNVNDLEQTSGDLLIINCNV